jgi:hypothetical protein
MNNNYLHNLKNLKHSQPQPVEQTPQYQPTTEADVWPKQSIYDINFEEFFRAANESTNNSIREAMEYMRVADAADAAEAAFGGDRGHGYGVVEESQPATETFSDQF